MICEFRESRQARTVGFVFVVDIEAKEFAKLPAPVGRFAIWRETPDPRRSGLYEFAQRALTLHKSRLRAHLIVDVERNHVPLNDRPGCISQRFCTGIHPAICPVRPTPTVSRGELLAARARTASRLAPRA